MHWLYWKSLPVGMWRFRTGNNRYIDYMKQLHAFQDIHVESICLFQIEYIFKTKSVSQYVLEI